MFLGIAYKKNGKNILLEQETQWPKIKEMKMLNVKFWLLCVARLGIIGTFHGGFYPILVQF